MITNTILSHLFESSIFFRKVFPYLKKEYFYDDEEKFLFNYIHIYFEKYNKQPSISDIRLFIFNDTKLNKKEYENIIKYLDKLKVENYDINTLIIEVEKWIQLRALELAILDSVEILEKRPQERYKIEEKVKDALKISFTSDLGHDYIKDTPTRFKLYKSGEEFFPSGIDTLDQAMGGGFTKKSLYLFLGKTNIGKTLFLCSIASNLLLKGYNVLYLTAEMSDYRIAQRIDSNILNININQLSEIEKTEFFDRIKSLVSKTSGKLIIKEYPTSTTNVQQIKAYLDELKLKKDFIPDFIIVDYLNIFNSYKLSNSIKSDSYNYMKSVSEEFRQLAVELNCGVISATQLNRESSSQKSIDNIDTTGISESFGMAMSADYMGAIFQTPELKQAGKILLKTVKTRFASNVGYVYTLGISYSYMRIFDLEQKDQELPLHVKDKLKLEINSFDKKLEKFDNFKF